MFHTDSLIIRILSLLSDLFILHFFWILCCIPLVTIGASTTALYYAMMKRIDTDEGSIVSNFWGSFKLNLKQSITLWLIELIVIVILLLDFRFCLMVSKDMRFFMLIIYGILLIPLCFTSLYIFPMQAKFDNPIKMTLKNSFMLSILNLPYTLLLLLITIGFFVLAFMIPNLLLPLIMFGMGIYSYITSFVYIHIFHKYIPNEDKTTIE